VEKILCLPGEKREKMKTSSSEGERNGFKKNPQLNSKRLGNHLSENEEPGKSLCGPTKTPPTTQNHTQLKRVNWHDTKQTTKKHEKKRFKKKGG